MLAVKFCVSFGSEAQEGIGIMSRIGKLTIDLPEKVEVKVSSGTVHVKGAKGTLQFKLPERISVSVNGSKVQVDREGEDRIAKSLHGLCRSTIANMVHGVSTGFMRELDINGVGYRAEVKGKE